VAEEEGFGAAALPQSRQHARVPRSVVIHEDERLVEEYA
jgi:hypothetical protein